MARASREWAYGDKRTDRRSIRLRLDSAKFEHVPVYANILAISPDGKHIYITKYQDGTAAAISVV